VSPQELDREPPGGGRFDEAGDATRRTHLANERTYLAWWRTALTSFAVALAVGRLAPDLVEDQTTWPLVVVGAGYALLGLVLVMVALQRQRAVDQAVRRGAYIRPSPTLLLGLTAAGVVLGILTLAVVLL
jgi:putative membrane protein